jgi:DNA-binding phage protein
MPIKPGSKKIGARRFGPLPLADGVSPAVRALFDKAWEERFNITHLARKSGASRENIYRWAKGHAPRLHDLEAAADVLGLKVILVDKELG